ncbi:MAG: cell division protein ZapA [Candidatus Eisenbacteria bacterium]|nr:cell division protein ZapA [Candidatus Eisenbacteria bacterium]
MRAHLVDEEMDDDNAVTVRILGEPFHIRGGTAEEVEAIAAYVGAKVDEVRQRNEGLPLRSLLILASLNIAEDLFRQRREHEEELRGIEDRTRAMRARLEADCLPIAIPD